MAITDLTGTKWQFNETVISDIGTDLFRILGKIYNNYYEINLDYGRDSIRGGSTGSGEFIVIAREAWNWVYPAFRINNYGNNRNWSYRQTMQSAYEYTPAPILEIYGGADATNTSCISWIQSNATQILPGYSITYHANGGTPEPTNLTEQTNLPSPLPTISKPNFSFDGWYTDSTFTTPAVAGAEISADTDLYAKFTRTHITLDLSTIGLPEGTHSIQMKLSGGNKRDSALSNAVSYTVEPEPTGEIWVINEDIYNVGNNTFTINFVSNNISFSSLTTAFIGGGQNVYIKYNEIEVCRINPITEVGTWVNENYRTITLEQAASGALLTWLQANAVKQ